MKHRIASFFALSIAFFTPGAHAAEPVAVVAAAHDRSVRLLAPSDVLERLESDNHEAAALARLLRQADLEWSALSGMAVTLTAVRGANEGERRTAKLLVQYHPTTDHAGFLLRVTSAEPTVVSRTMMDLEYRRVPESADYQLVGWHQL